MNYFSIFLFIFSFSIGVTTIAISLKMYKMYHLKYLLNYSYYLIFFYVFGFLSLIGRYLAEATLEDLLVSQHIVQSIGIIFSFLAFPFILIAWYMFILMVRGFLEKPLAPAIKTIYIAYTISSIFIYAKVVKDYIDSHNKSLSDTASVVAAVMNIILVIIIYTTILHLFFKLKDISDKNKQNAIKTFAYLNLVIFTIYFAVVFIIFQRLLKSSSLFFIFMPFLHFSLNLPPLLYLKRYLNRYCIEYRLRHQSDEEISAVLSRFELSQREQEIIRLILLGKSNNEIADELFISIKTVKNNIYNIYKRFNLKNRVQLANFFRNFK